MQRAFLGMSHSPLLGLNPLDAAVEAGDEAEVVGLVVDADARRTGTGRKLIAAAEDWARARGLRELFLRSNIVRPEAHAFYPALGFERSKTQHVYRKALT